MIPPIAAELDRRFVVKFESSGASAIRAPPTPGVKNPLTQCAPAFGVRC